MSGPSTLRICLAAMAPALTEAASARLRLQDTPDTPRNNKTFKSCYVSDSVEIPRTITVSNNDIRALGGRKRSIGEGRATHPSLADSCERDTIDLHLNTQVSTITGKARNPQGCPKADNSLSRTNALTRFDISKIDFVPKRSVGSPFYVSEDFQESCPLSQTTSTLLHKLKIMNKPETGALIDKESSIIRSEKSPIEDTSEILKSNLQHASASKDSEPRSSMVNGNGDIDKKSESEDGGKGVGGERVSPRKKVPTPVNKRSVHFYDTEKPCAELKKVQEKMGLACTAKDPAPEDSKGICSLAVSTSQLQAVEMLDMKSRDETRKECARKQAYLERKVETLLRRLKRMRGKVVETHSREQLRQFVNYQHRSLQQVAKVMRSEAPGPAELKEHFLSNNEVKSMSTTELVKLVKTYQPLASSRNHRHPSQHMSEHRGISSSLARFGGPSGSVGPVMVIEPGLRSQVSEVSERLGQRVSTVSAELDSDATASSSGGESGDEDGGVTLKPKVTSSADMPPLFKRAEWRWASDRAAIVSRWTWLQAQVSDLEYRIRQQSQVHRQLRASKGGVVLGDPPSTADILRRLQGMAPNAPQVNTSCSEADGQEKDHSLPDENREGGLEVSPFNIQSVMSNVDKQASRLSQSLGNCLSPASSRSSVSAPPSVVGSPRLHSSTSSPGRSPAQTGGKDSTVGGQTGDLEDGSTADGGPVVPTELSLASRTSDLLHTPELQRQQHSRVLPPPPSSSSLSSSSSSSLFAQPQLDATCQSARCRPLRSYRKRRILRTVGLHRHSQKAARLSDVRCRCSPPANPCPMCGGRQNNTIPMDMESMAMRERIALVDASYHPVLSFPEDVPLSIHCEGLLKSGLWQDKPSNKRYRGSHRPQHYRGGLMLSKDYHFNNKNHQNNINNNKKNNHHHHQDSVLSFMSGEIGQSASKKKKVRKTISVGSVGQNGKNNATGGSSTASVIKNFSEKIKNKYDSKAKSKSSTTKVKVLPSRPKTKKKTSKVAKDTYKKKRQADAREDDEDLEALYLEEEFGDIDAENGGGSLSASASQSSLRDLGHQQSRSYRRKVDNSYDINNIVIPLSMATSVPVEQPQYKEIVTPKWREAPLQDLSPASVAAVAARESLAIKLEKTNGVAKPAEPLKLPDSDPLPEIGDAESLHEAEEKSKEEVNEKDEEDLSDEAFALRHLKLELEEKKRFRNFVQYPPLRRSRARSDVSLSAMDSRDGGQSEENSLSSRPTTPVLMKSLPSVSSGRGSSLEESLANLQSQRPRTVSVSTPTGRRDTRQGSQCSHDGVDVSRDAMLEPWPRRSFPLPTEEYEQMLEEAPPELKSVMHEHETRYACSNTAKPALGLKDSSIKEEPNDIGRPVETLLDSMAIAADSVALSPQSVSASASSAADDDAADPEWMGGGDNSTTSSSSSCKRRGRQILDDPNDPEWLGSDTPRKNKNKR